MTSRLRIFSDLGPALRLLRETVAALKQTQVAERTGITQGRLSRYENERKIPDLRTLDRLLACYGVDVEGLGRALKEVRRKRAANTQGNTPGNTPGADPEVKAMVKQALIELGYIKLDEPD